MVTSIMGNSATGARLVDGSLWRTRSFARSTKRLKHALSKLLLEKLPLAGIVRVEGVSESWLQSYVNEKYAAVERQAKLEAKKGR